MTTIGKIILTAWYIWGFFVYDDDIIPLWAVFGFGVVMFVWLGEEDEPRKDEDDSLYGP